MGNRVGRTHKGPSMANTESFAGAPGTAYRGSSGLRTASGTVLGAGTSISGFVAPGKFLDSFFFTGTKAAVLVPHKLSLRI